MKNGYDTRKALVLALTAALAAGNTAAAERTFPVGPERVWRAVINSDAKVLAVDHARFEVSLALAENERLQLSVDWDETGGGTRVSWSAASGDDGRIARWLDGIGAAALAQPHPNRYCRGLTPDPRHDEIAEPSLDAATDCGMSTGNFSSALFELEKCGDYETTLKLLAICSRQDHAGGLVRISQLYELGAGVPQRPERMTHFLARAAMADGTAYHIVGKTLYATALYFGVGTIADRPRALTLFRTAASLGDSAAADFLRSGTHTAWRRADGGFFRDPDFRLAAQP